MRRGVQLIRNSFEKPVTFPAYSDQEDSDRLALPTGNLRLKPVGPKVQDLENIEATAAACSFCPATSAVLISLKCCGKTDLPPAVRLRLRYGLTVTGVPRSYRRSRVAIAVAGRSVSRVYGLGLADSGSAAGPTGPSSRNCTRHYNDEVPTGMSCNDALVARPLSPMKEALAVTLTYLGGVLSSHLGYDPRRKQVTHDWLWSVGSHPMSFTST
eukprot:gene20486-27274_t